MNRIQIYIQIILANAFIKNMQLFVGGKFILAATTLAVGVITARLLTPEDRGLYVLFFTVGGLIFSLLHIGLSPANIYFLNKKKIGMGILIGNAFTYILLAMCLLAVIFLVFVSYGFQGPFLGYSPLLVWALIWLTVLINLLEASFSGLAMGANRYDFLSRSLTFQSIALLASTSLIPVFGSYLLPSVTLRVFGISAFIVWFLVTFLKQVEFKKLGICLLTLKAQLRFGGKNWLQNIIGFLNLRSYLILLAFFSDPKIVGFFSVAWIFVEIIRFFPDAIATMLLPELTKKESYKEQVLLTTKSMRLILVLVALIATAVFLLVDVVLPMIFGMEYVFSINTAKLLLIGSVFGVIYQVTTRFFTSQDKQIYSLVSGILGLMAGLISCITLIPNYSAEGAAVAFIISAFSTGVFSLFFFCREAEIKVIEVFRFKSTDFSIT